MSVVQDFLINMVIMRDTTGVKIVVRRKLRGNEVLRRMKMVMRHYGGKDSRVVKADRN